MVAGHMQRVVLDTPGVVVGNNLVETGDNPVEGGHSLVELAAWELVD